MNLVGLWQRVSPMAHCLPIPTVMSMRHYVGCLRPKDNENAEQQLKVSRRDIFIRKDERAASASLKKPSSDPSIHHKSASRTLITKLWSRVNASRAVNLIWMCVCVHICECIMSIQVCAIRWERRVRIYVYLSVALFLHSARSLTAMQIRVLPAFIMMLFILVNTTYICIQQPPKVRFTNISVKSERAYIAFTTQYIHLKRILDVITL